MSTNLEEPLGSGSEKVDDTLPPPDADVEAHKLKAQQQQDDLLVDGPSVPPTNKTERRVTGLSWLVLVLAILSSTFLYALDNTITADVRPSIIETFGNRVAMLPWLSVSYPMAEVGSNPLWGKLNNYINNKTLYLIALLIFEVGSAVIGAAPSLAVVIGGRVLAGVGGSGIYVGTLNIVSALTRPDERNQYLTLVGMAWSLGTILGPLVGGALADSPTATWRWAFYLNICIAAVAAPVCIWLIPPVVPPGSSSNSSSSSSNNNDDDDEAVAYRRPLSSSSTLWWHRLRRLDVVGAVLFVGAVASTIMMLGFGGALYDWTSGQLIGLYVATVVLWGLFAVQQGRGLLTRDRIFPAQFVRRPEMDILFCWTAVAISQVVVIIYSLPLFFQFALGLSSLRSAVYTIPFVAAMVVSAALLGPLFPRYPYYMAWMVGSSALMLVGNGLLTTMAYHGATPPGTLCGYTVLVGVACGPVMQLGYAVAQNKLPRALGPQVTAFLSCAQMAGLALSLGVATTVFLNEATTHIQAIVSGDGGGGLSRQAIQGMINGVNTGLLAELSAEVQLRILEAVARSVGKVFYLNIASAALGLVTSLFLKRERLQFRLE